MSSTSLPRNVARPDFYRTPSWAVDAIVPTLRSALNVRDRGRGHIPKPDAWRILDAGAGDGAICDVIARHLPTSHVNGIEADRMKCRATAPVLPSIWRGDFLVDEMNEAIDAIVMNPPFSQAQAFVKRAIDIVSETDGVVVALLRLGWMAGQARAAFHREYRSDVYVLPKRPSFTGGGTDSADYGWFVWRAPFHDNGGRWRVLDISGGTQ